MKTPQLMKLAPLVAVVLGGFALAPSFAETPGQQAGPQGMQPKAESSAQPPQSGTPEQKGNSPAQLIQDKIQQACQRADKNHDGYISKSEYKALQKVAKIDFKKADSNHKGRLDMAACAKALGTS